MEVVWKVSILDILQTPSTVLVLKWKQAAAEIISTTTAIIIKTIICANALKMDVYYNLNEAHRRQVQIVRCICIWTSEMYSSFMIYTQTAFHWSFFFSQFFISSNFIILKTSRWAYIIFPKSIDSASIWNSVIQKKILN